MSERNAPIIREDRSPVTDRDPPPGLLASRWARAGVAATGAALLLSRLAGVAAAFEHGPGGAKLSASDGHDGFAHWWAVADKHDDRNQGKQDRGANHNDQKADDRPEPGAKQSHQPQQPAKPPSQAKPDDDGGKKAEDEARKRADDERRGREEADRQARAEQDRQAKAEQERPARENLARAEAERQKRAETSPSKSRPDHERASPAAGQSASSPGKAHAADDDQPKLEVVDNTRTDHHGTKNGDSGNRPTPDMAQSGGTVSHDGGVCTVELDGKKHTRDDWHVVEDDRPRAADRVVGADQRHEQPPDDVAGEHANRPDYDSEKITICHATGSATNPYVMITISKSGLKGHGDHQDQRDIIPAPAEGRTSPQNVGDISAPSGGAGTGEATVEVGSTNTVGSGNGAGANGHPDTDVPGAAVQVGSTGTSAATVVGSIGGTTSTTVVGTTGGAVGGTAAAITPSGSGTTVSGGAQGAGTLTNLQPGDVDRGQAQQIADRLGGGIQPEDVQHMGGAEIAQVARAAGVPVGEIESVLGESVGRQVVGEGLVEDVLGVQVRRTYENVVTGVMPSTGGAPLVPLTAGLAALGGLGLALRRFGRRP